MGDIACPAKQLPLIAVVESVSRGLVQDHDGCYVAKRKDGDLGLSRLRGGEGKVAVTALRSVIGTWSCKQSNLIQPTRYGRGMARVGHLSASFLYAADISRAKIEAASHFHSRLEFLGVMPTPSSISRDAFANRFNAVEFSSILGKRERALGEDATTPPVAKRPAPQSPPPAEIPGKYRNRSTPNSGSPSSASDVDEPEGLKADSKARSTRGTFCALPYMAFSHRMADQQTSGPTPPQPMGVSARFILGSCC